jgi:gluconolactonase|tara:strand:+ start:416 stop:1291 length:876 start_codon:yes stop_codon:yes gene_type:complete
MNNTKFEEYTKNLNLKQIHSGSIWTEGPCYLKKSNKVVWSDIPNNRMLSFDFNKVEIFRSPSNFSNGNTTDNQGNLVTCEHGARRVTTTDKNNVISLIVDEYDEKRLNSPNDICVHSNGTIFFTDPPFGIINPKRVEGFPGHMMYGGCYVFKYEPKTKKLEAIVTNMEKPNGIALSLDESHLLISNTGDTKYIRRYDIDKSLKISKPIEFAKSDPEHVFDGFRFDVDNNLWTSCGKGVACYASSGEQIGYIKMPELVSNVDFGGTEGKTLFITASTSLYMANLNIKGAKFK